MRQTVVYTYTVRATYTDEYRACIWTSLSGFIIPILRIYINYQIQSHFRKARTLLDHAIHNGMSPLREMVILTLGQNNHIIHASLCETHCL